MSESSASAGAGEPRMDHGDGAVVILRSLWWKNPFFWMALGMGIPIAVLMAAEGEQMRSTALIAATLTILLAGVALLALDARLEIRPDGFREVFAFGRTTEYRWTDVSGFAVRKDPESESAVCFLILKKGRATGETGMLTGAYEESVEALTDRMNAARENALGPEAIAFENARPRIGMRRP